MKIFFCKKSGLRLSPFEIASARPFLLLVFYCLRKIKQALRYVVYLGQVQKLIQDNACNTVSSHWNNEGAIPSEINPWDQILLKTWKERPHGDQWLPQWDGTSLLLLFSFTPTLSPSSSGYLVTLCLLLTISTAVKLQGVYSWVHLSRLSFYLQKFLRSQQKNNMSVNQ